MPELVAMDGNKLIVEFLPGIDSLSVWKGSIGVLAHLTIFSVFPVHIFKKIVKGFLGLALNLLYDLLGAHAVRKEIIVAVGRKWSLYCITNLGVGLL